MLFSFFISFFVSPRPNFLLLALPELGPAVAHAGLLVGRELGEAEVVAVVHVVVDGVPAGQVRARVLVCGAAPCRLALRRRVVDQVARPRARVPLEGV